MIIATIRIKEQKAGGIVAFIAFDISWRMKIRLTQGQFTVMAFATGTKYLLMIDRCDLLKSERNMAGFA